MLYFNKMIKINEIDHHKSLIDKSIKVKNQIDELIQDWLNGLNFFEQEIELRYESLCCEVENPAKKTIYEFKQNLIYGHYKNEIDNFKLKKSRKKIDILKFGTLKISSQLENQWKELLDFLKLNKCNNIVQKSVPFYMWNEMSIRCFVKEHRVSNHFDFYNKVIRLTSEIRVLKIEEEKYYADLVCSTKNMLHASILYNNSRCNIDMIKHYCLIDDWRNCLFLVKHDKMIRVGDGIGIFDLFLKKCLEKEQPLVYKKFLIILNIYVKNHKTMLKHNIIVESCKEEGGYMYPIEIYDDDEVLAILYNNSIPIFVGTQVEETYIQKVVSNDKKFSRYKLLCDKFAYRLASGRNWAIMVDEDD